MLLEGNCAPIAPLKDAPLIWNTPSYTSSEPLEIENREIHNSL